MREQQQPAFNPRLVLVGVLSCFGGVASAACPPGMTLLYGKCQKVEMSAGTVCSAQVTNANPKLVTSKAPGDKEKLQALIAECVKNYEQQQAQATRKERQSSWQAAPGAASSGPGAAVSPAPGARAAAGAPAGAPQSALPAVQAPAQVSPTAVAKPLPDVPLACSVSPKGIKYAGGLPQREFEIEARNDSGAPLAAAYRIVWTVKKASPPQTGVRQLRAPLAANASVKVGTAVQPSGLPELTACEAVARF